jgi:hypothetical protein
VQWTVFKSQLCGFAEQKYSTNPQLKNCRLTWRYKRKPKAVKNIKSLLFLLISFSFFSIYSHAADPKNNDKPYLYPDIYPQCKNGQLEPDIDKCLVTEINKALNYLAEIQLNSTLCKLRVCQVLPGH